MHIMVYDLDGTISETSFPRPHTPLNLTDAVRIMDPGRVALDRPRPAIVDWMRHVQLYAGRDTVICILTGRPEASRTLTEAWLLVHGVPYHDLIMVGEPGCRPTSEKKRAYLEQWKVDYESILVVDDDPKVGAVCVELDIGFVLATEVV